ncbi:hypothetical protein BKA57DRAFT_209938 [Linnemannia elongata]|nr:hypothetical protein BKA57DRAFT_253205 [Linnemannia elongata]KAH7056666.1 hypothetical protein BKA57DRAFT_209938 [Linnemannia elongata]
MATVSLTTLVVFYLLLDQLCFMISVSRVLTRFASLTFVPPPFYNRIDIRDLLTVSRNMQPSKNAQAGYAIVLKMKK